MNQIPKVPLEVAKKVLTPLELKVYQLLLQFEKKESEDNGRDKRLDK